LSELSVTIISPKWVRSPQQGKSGGRTVNFSLWKARLGMEFPPSLTKQLYRCDSVVVARLWEEGIPRDVG